MATKPTYATPRVFQDPFRTKSGVWVVPSFTITGLEESRKFLNKIPIDVRDKVLGKALRKGGEVLRAEEYRNAPVPKRAPVEKRIYWGRQRSGRPRKTKMVLTRGVLKKSLATATAIITKKNWDKHPIVWVGPPKGRKAKPYDAWYAHFYEFGTVNYKGRFLVGRSITTVYDKCVSTIRNYIVDYFNKHYDG